MSALGRLLCLFALVACGASQSQSTTPQREVVEMEELRITAARGAEGYRFEVYDAADLFKKATEDRREVLHFGLDSTQRPRLRAAMPEMPGAFLRWL